MRRTSTKRTYQLKSVVGATQSNDAENLREALDTTNQYAADDLAKALHIAASNGYDACAKLLLPLTAKPDFPDQYGCSALILAAKNGHLSTLKLLLSHNCNMNATVFPAKTTALHYAAANGHVDCVLVLIRAGCDKDTRTMHGKTPLMYAAKSGHTSLVRELVRLGSEVDAADKEGWTALHYASRANQPDCASFLLRAGARVNRMTTDNKSPLIMAAFQGHIKVMKVLLRDLKIDLSIKSCEMSVMHWAALSKSAESVQLLIEYSVDCDPKTTDSYTKDRVVLKGVTPLMLACSVGATKVAELLITSGANINAFDEIGQSPLMCAVKKNYDKCALKLLQCKADQHGNLLSYLGLFEKRCTPLYVAIKNTAIDCMRVLLQYSNCILYIGCIQLDSSIEIIDAALMSRFPEDCVDMLLIAGYNFMPSSILANFNPNSSVHMALMDRYRNPRSLKEISRLSIRTNLRRCLAVDMFMLPLPNILLQYLRFPELDMYTS